MSVCFESSEKIADEPLRLLKRTREIIVVVCKVEPYILLGKIEVASTNGELVPVFAVESTLYVGGWFISPLSLIFSRELPLGINLHIENISSEILLVPVSVLHRFTFQRVYKTRSIFNIYYKPEKESIIFS